MKIRFKFYLIHSSIVFLTVALTCCFSSLSFIQHPKIKIDAFSKTATSISKSNYREKAFFTTSIFDEKNNKNMSNNIFLSDYPINFTKHFLETTIYLDPENKYEMSNFELSCSNSMLDNCKWCDNVLYSNQVDLKRFETVNINLYKTPNRSEELNTYGLEGFIYIPDYYADSIIESSGGELKTYDDLLPDLSSKSAEERDAFLEKYSIHLSYKTSFIGRFKISNIFRVNDFSKYATEQTVYNDLNNGLLLHKLLGNYFFSFYKPPSSHLKALVTIIDSKQFILNQILSNYYQIKENCSISIDFFSVSSDSKCKNENINSLVGTLFSSMSYFNIFTFILFLCFLILFGLLFIKKTMRTVFLKKRVIIVSFSFCLLLGFIIQILSYFLRDSYLFNTFFSIAFFLPFVLLFCAQLVFLIYLWRIRQND